MSIILPLKPSLEPFEFSLNVVPFSPPALELVIEPLLIVVIVCSVLRIIWLAGMLPPLPPKVYVDVADPLKALLCT